MISLGCFGITASIAQNSSGINTPTPNPKAALEIKTAFGTSQGLLIPRLKTVDRPAFNPLTELESGLMFYDTDKDSIFYWTGANWLSLMTNSSTTPTTGTGVVNNVARWTTSSNLGTGILKDNGSRVYIGAETGTGDLNVNSTSTTSIRLANTGASVGLALITGYSTQLKNKIEFTDDLYFSPVAYASLGVGANPVNYMVMKNNGNVGIGTPPTEKLHLYSGDVTSALIQASSVGFSVAQASLKLQVNADIWELKAFRNILSMTTQRPELTIGVGGQNLFNFTYYTLEPWGDNVKDLGTSVYRWKDIYLANAPKVSSDRRLKENIETLKYGLDAIQKLKPVTYSLKDDVSHKTKLGLIAQEVRTIIPEVVSGNESKGENLSITYSDLIPVLINSIKEQQKTIDSLITQNKSFSNRILLLEKK
ncbi:MAG: tail fiber domain-containing protein [Opitutaceae bacterium]|nr:tail fiber domain-containing protein [Cytophagales bacterium]